MPAWEKREIKVTLCDDFANSITELKLQYLHIHAVTNEHLLGDRNEELVDRLV